MGYTIHISIQPVYRDVPSKKTHSSASAMAYNQLWAIISSVEVLTYNIKDYHQNIY